MSDNLTAIFLASGNQIIDALVVITVFVGSLWLILHYLAKMRASRQPIAPDAASVEAMHAITQRLEQRIQVLEQILDAELPAWRGHPANFYRQAS